ncbi:Pls/PosA family non-ribosomal peptide synthetase [Streptomyces sp. NBC_00259]|uniref:Pls/PosA family non-ribosomal peptide synthetase n=1 Tax=Streptomyces sp. NBC_00259 TaxID=2903643 RepID=UPI002E2B5AF0|nr:Pls/PosA family non-ribosomal peptide synthetase [Streptomyces sp. NBC_00259]
MAEVLAGVLGVEEVPVEGDFFTELGADSLVMARFCARIRKRDDLPTVSMTDVYRHPMIRSLAAAFTDATPTPGPTPTPAPASVPASPAVPAQAEAPSGAVSGAPSGSPEPSPEPPSGLPDEPGPASRSRSGSRVPDGARAVVPDTWQYVWCGASQLLLFLLFSSLGALAGSHGCQWAAAGSGAAGFYLRAVVFGGAVFLGLCALPVVAKWLLIGRFTARRIPVWSAGYLRFWCVKTLIRTSPVRLLTGSPLYVLYLRALGAKVGRGAVVFSKHIPVCTDLLTIGEGTVVRKDVHFSCYRAHAGAIETGPVTLGRQVTVSEQTVLDVGTSMGDGAQLGHASALHTGQSVPAGQAWHGSPAQPAGGTDFRAVVPARCGSLRRALYGLWQLSGMVLVYLPLTMAGVGVLLTALPQSGRLLTSGPPPVTSAAFYGETLAVSFVVFFGALLARLLLAGTVPRLLSRLFLTPGRVYPLYGFHHGIQRAVTRMTNVKFLTLLFGDSSAIVHYLRHLGYDLRRIEQTGSNFGSLVKHDSPYLSDVGSGTVVADGLSIVNADFSSTSFRLSRASIGAHNFLGNNIAYPSRGRTGDNCLLATKVMVPIDGPVREGVGLLGSPAFEIPRTVLRDTRLDHISGADLRGRLAAKNRHNAVTAVLHLLVRWVHFFGVTLIALAAARLHHSLGAAVFAPAALCTLVFTVVYFVLAERAVTARRPMKPLACSIYEPSFWQHERFWKLATHTYMQAFNGTPFKPLVWRMLGVRIGRRVFDDGASITERTLTTIGDDCTLNAASKIQCHSQEDGAFKRDDATIGAGVTLGVGAFVHYGVTVGDHAQLAADSFLMKGEEVPPNARWGGNPAREVRDNRACNGHDAAVPARVT